MQFFHHKNKSQPSLLSSFDDQQEDIQHQHQHNPHRRDGSQHSLGPHPTHPPGYIDSSSAPHDGPTYPTPPHAVTQSDRHQRLQQTPRPFSVHYTTAQDHNNNGTSNDNNYNYKNNPESLSATDLSSNSPVAEPSPQVETQQPRKSRISFFGRNSKDKDKNKDKDKDSKGPGRSLSVRKKTAGPAVLRKHHNNPNNNNNDRAFESTKEREEESVVNDHRMPQNSVKPSQPQSQHPYPSRAPNRSSSRLDSLSFKAPTIQRVNTEPLAQREDYYQTHPPQHAQYQQEGTRPGSSSQHPQFQIDQPQVHSSDRAQQFADQVSIPPRYSPQLDPYSQPRPLSQQSLGPPSPLYPPYQTSDSNSQKSQFRQSLQPASGAPQNQPGMAQDRPTGLRQPVDTVQQQHQQQQQQQQQQPQPQQQQQPQHGQAQAQPSQAPQQYPPSMPQGSSFKGNMSQTSIGERDQETPTPASGKSKENISDMDARAVVQKYEELQHKYNKVKRYYFEKDAQVQQLQNTVAHQRMSTSRTVLDDNEYTTRFNRLDGAISNLAFNIRKDWKCIPPWLQSSVNDDAHIKGQKEMTAVGRACLTRWIVDEIFDRYFHPALEPGLSRQLKQIERNVRQLGKFATEEDKENHYSKISSWRRTTLDGLGDTLSNKLGTDHRSHLTRNLVEKLTASLEMNLKSPPPPGLENGVSMIVELVVGLISNMPLESREITIEYALPGALIVESQMKVETALPPLTNPGPENRASEPSSAATDRVDQSSMKGIDSMNAGEPGPEDGRDNGSSKESRKKSVFGNLMGKKTQSNVHSTTNNNGNNNVDARPGSAADQRDKEEPTRIRFSAFVSVAIRQKGSDNIVVKAPVYPLA